MIRFFVSLIANSVNMSSSANIGVRPIGTPSQPSCSNSRDSDNEVSCAKSSDSKTPSVEPKGNLNLPHDVSMMSSESPDEQNKDFNVSHALATGEELQMQEEKVQLSGNQGDTICEKSGQPDIPEVATGANVKEPQMEAASDVLSCNQVDTICEKSGQPDIPEVATGANVKEPQMEAASDVLSCNQVDTICEKSGQPDIPEVATGANVKEPQMEAASDVLSCNQVDTICEKSGQPDILEVTTGENLNLNKDVQDTNPEDGEQAQTPLNNKDILININSEIISSDKNNSETTTEIAQNINIKDYPVVKEDGSQNNINAIKENVELEQDTMSKVEKIEECAENSEELTFIKSEVEEKASECDEIGLVAKGELANQTVEEELEDGEVSSDDENDKSPTSLDTQNICRFFLRKACTWGSKCRFHHPTSKDYGNYVMFEKKELPVSLPPVAYSAAWPAYNSNITTGSENSFDRNLQSVKQMMRKAGYFPPTTNRKFQESPATMTFSFNNNAYYYQQKKPSSPVDRVKLLPTPSTAGASETKVPRTSTPLRKSRSPKLLPSHHQNAADERKPSKSRNLKRKSRKSRSSSSSSSSSVSSSESSSDPQESVRRHQRKSGVSSAKSAKTRNGRSPIRGPRTPSLSPPRAYVRNIVNAPRKRRLSSSSSSSNDSSSTSYDLSTCNSSSSECQTNRRKTLKTKTSSQKSSSVRASSAKSKKEDEWKSGRSRQEYLLMKLLHVEDQIAKKRQMK
ncbi:zinc finger CCCH domain-containing protein 18 [Drosophila tropicalis]|uniref:zinc finger CCCH domain-containing protein 18 n=1 Tax=Drosophila tropicalis TaxID=46794 RepID=UPI0035ABD08C